MQKIHMYLFNNSKIQKMCEIIGIILLLFVILIPRTSQIGYRWNNIVNSLYLTFSKITFIFGISLLTLPSLLTYKPSIVLFIMDNKFTNFISKISFMVYLIHLFVIMQSAYTKKVQFYYAIIPLFALFISHAIIACFIAFWLVICVQVPSYQLQKMLMKNIEKVNKNQD